MTGETVGHDPIVFGPVAAGERTISGKVYELPGYGWACSCGFGSQGHTTEAEAEEFVDRHLARVQGGAT